MCCRARGCSGLGDFIGPGDVNGYCPTQVVRDDSPTAATYYATGVLSETNEFLFTGNSQNVRAAWRCSGRSVCEPQP